MNSQKPSKEEQIKAIIDHRAYDLIMKYTPPEKLSSEAYAEIFSIKRDEILDFLVRNYQLGDLIPKKSMQKDGFYAIPVEGGFNCYEQYDGLKAKKNLVVDVLGVWKKFVDYVIRTSGTGLEFS